MTTKKSKKQRHVLILAVVVAGAIVAGSTFAWFASKDEVTNRLSATANYNVSIAEDFQPPEEWIPGQTINKDVSAVNAGNVDAFVRMWLGGQMRVLSDTSANDKVSANITASPNFVAVTDTSKTNLGLKYAVGNKYYKVLSKETVANPNAAGGGEETNQPAAFSEVQSMQAAGVLVYAPKNAKYTWTLEQPTTLNVGTYASNTPQTLAKGTKVGTNPSTATTKIAGAKSDDSNYYGSIDASTFKPETTGLYLFRRTIIETADGTANKYEYSGYYYDAAKDEYFALYTTTGVNGHSDYVLPANAVADNSTANPSKNQVLPVTINSVYFATATDNVIDNADLTWTYDATNKKFTVTNGAAAADKKIAVDVALANIGTDSEKWTAMPATAGGNKTTFYYNNDVEEGDTTTKLVDSVTLSKDTQVGAYLAFDFDLNVFMESVQVTMDEDGNEAYTSVTPWSATGTENTGAKGTGTMAANEISKITWSAAT